MSYKVETTAEEHELVLRETIIHWTKQDYDVHLVSKEGHRIFSHKILLSFYSSHLQKIFNEPLLAFSSEPMNISLPSSSSASITSMLKVLATGRCSANQRSDLKEIKETARSLGIDLKNCFIENGKYSSSKSELSNLNLSQKEKVLAVPLVITNNKGEEMKCEMKFNACDTPTNDSEQHICNVCDAVFRSEKNLNRHRRMQHRLLKRKEIKAGNLNCDLCGTFFKARKYLLTHRRIKHGIKKNRVNKSETETVLKEEIQEELVMTATAKTLDENYDSC